MKRIELAELDPRWRSLTREVETQPIIITEDGQPVAAIIPFDELDAEAYALGSDPAFIAMIEAARADIRSGNGIPLDDLIASYGLTQGDLEAADGELPAELRRTS